MEDPIQIREALRYGWQTWKKRPLFHFALTVLPLVFSTTVNTGSKLLLWILTLALQKSFSDGLTVITIVIQIILFIFVLVVRTILAMGIVNIYLRISRGEQPVLRDVWALKKRFIPYYLTSLLVGLCVTLGFIALIIPGVIFSLMFCLAPYVSIDTTKGPLDAMRQSRAMTKGIRIELFFFFLSMALVNMLGLLCLIIGMIVTIPVTALASAYIYEILRKKFLESQANPIASIQNPVEARV